MAIEPVSSIMTVQAQGSAVQKPKAPVQVEKPESTVSSVQAAEQVERTVSVVHVEKVATSSAEECRANFNS